MFGGGGTTKPTGCAVMVFFLPKFVGSSQAFSDAYGRRKVHVSAFVGSDADDSKVVIALRQQTAELLPTRADRNYQRQYKR